MKNAFYFILKALLILKIFTFLSWLFGHVEKRLFKKVRLISKFMTSQYDWQTITIHILRNISRSKGNQTMKFGQLIEYNLKTIFFKNHTQSILEKLFPGTFPKSQNWAYLSFNNLKFDSFCFYCMPSWELSKYIEIKL